MRIRFVRMAAILGLLGSAAWASSDGHGLYFPPAGQRIENQDRRTAEEVGMAREFAGRIEAYIREHPYAAREGRRAGPCGGMGISCMCRETFIRRLM